MQRLIDTPKGKIEYAAGESFLLHVFWETPSMAAAEELLQQGLRKCAIATHRDTPCVPLYFFRVSANDAPLCDNASKIPKTVGDLPALRDAIKKLQVGTPAGAVRADLAKRGFDATIVSMVEALDPAAPLPEALQQRPVMVELTELYMDERAFMEHVGSRDYLNAYGVVMKPSLMLGKPRTLRLGTPPASVIDKILEPMLQETAVPLREDCHLWVRPESQPDQEGASFNPQHAVFLAFDVPSQRDEQQPPPPPPLLLLLSKQFQAACSTLVSFPHPHRPDTTRFMCVLPSLISSSSSSREAAVSILAELTGLGLIRGEAHLCALESVIKADVSTAPTAVDVAAAAAAAAVAASAAHKDGDAASAAHKDGDAAVAAAAAAATAAASPAVPLASTSRTSSSSSLPTPLQLSASQLQPAVDALRSLLTEAGIAEDKVVINTTMAVGYVFHQRAAEISSVDKVEKG